MMTGYRGTFVISWKQTEVDGLENAPIATLGVGANWRWTGTPVRVDGPADVLLLEGAGGEADLRRRAARAVHKLVGAALDPAKRLDGDDGGADAMPDVGFEVTDGRKSYLVTVIVVSRTTPPLLMFLGEAPPRDTDLWVVHSMLEGTALNRVTDQPTGVICFTPGTMIRTGDGALPVEMLREGDKVQTKDDGLAEIRWIGQRRITGARLFAMPELRPVRLRIGSLGQGEPDGDLVVSPQHRLVVRGDRARALFNTDEVLVAAEHLVDGRGVLFDYSLREVVYYHLLLDRHQVVWANGVETESFHPANTELGSIEEDQRSRLFEMFPDLSFDPRAYGDFARRNLSKAETYILRGAVA